MRNLAAQCRDHNVFQSLRWVAPHGRATDFRAVLEELSRLRLADPQVRRAAGGIQWLGRPPVSDAGIAAVEGRLGKRLPPSYRAFLRASNGFSHPDGSSRSSPRPPA